MQYAHLSQMLLVPLKQTSDFDWTPQLLKFITGNDEDPSTYRAQMASFNRLRMDCRGANPDNTGRDIIYRYFAQLELLSLRFPVNEGPLTHVEFIWFDAFDPSISVHQTSLAFEKANLLFNLAALFTQIGAKQPPDVAGLKSAYHAYQSAASIFHWVSENFLHPPLADISRDSLSFLSTLMLAQAQECAAHKAIMDKKSPSILAKLFSSAAALYSEAHGKLSTPGLADGQVNFDSSWLEVISTKAAYAAALAAYHKGEACYAETMHGECLARFAMAQSSCQAALQFAGKNMPALTQTIKSLQAHITSRTAIAEKENGLIYHHAVPTSESLQPVEKVALTKIYTLPEITSEFRDSAGADIFQSLVPMRVHQETSTYSEEKAKLLRYETLKVSTADDELQSTLKSLGFPQALEDLDKNELGIPPRVTALRQGIRSNDNSIDRLLERQQDSSQSLNLKLQAITRLLEAEERAFQQEKIKYGNDWTQTPSHSCNAQLYAQHAEIKNSLHLNQKNDEAIVAQYKSEAQADIALLLGPEAKLQAAFPHEDLIGVDSDNGSDKIKAIVERLELLSKERNSMLESFKAQVLGDDISQAVLRHRGSTAGLFQKELTKFDDACRRLEDNVALHGSTIAELRQLWQALENRRTRSIQAQSKEQAIFRFENSVKIFLKSIDSLKKSASLNDGLLTKAMMLQLSCETFSKQRTEERDTIVQKFGLQEAKRGQQYLLDKLRQLEVKGGAKANAASESLPAASVAMPSPSLPAPAQAPLQIPPTMPQTTQPPNQMFNAPELPGGGMLQQQAAHSGYFSPYAPHQQQQQQQHYQMHPGQMFPGQQPMHPGMAMHPFAQMPQYGAATPASAYGQHFATNGNAPQASFPPANISSVQPLIPTPAKKPSTTDSQPVNEPSLLD